MTCAANSPHVDRLGVSLPNRGVWLSDGFYTSLVQYVHRRCAMHRLSCHPKSSLASQADPRSARPFAQVRRRLRQARHPVRLLGRHGGLLQISGVGDADRRISFERTLESQLFCPFAYLRKHLLAEQTDAVHGILMRNVPIVAPDRHDAWARFFQQVTNARQHLLRRPAQDHAISTLLFESWVATRIFGATYRELDEIAPPAG